MIANNITNKTFPRTPKILKAYRPFLVDKAICWLSTCLTMKR
nr:MAG TPA_asm: hypothetical protein [Caudoviricetes sp.]